MLSHPPDSDDAATVRAPNLDPLLLDTEQIESLAAATVIRSALRHCNERRVTALERSDAGLWAEVEDEESSDKLQLEIGLGDDGALSGLCDCQTEEAPDSDAARLCVHAVAALFAYAQGQGDAVRLADAAQMAREERIAKARSEVRVQPLSIAADRTGRGLWSARSIQSTTHFPTQYRVHIRTLNRRANHCTCPDFATNQLGTCKHVEAVLHRIRKRHDFDRLKAQPPALPYVYLDWECEQPPAIRLQRGESISADLEMLLREHFDSTGRFRLRLPEDFLRFAELAGAREDVEIGDDALGHAQRLAEDAVRAVRAVDIGEQIRAGGGRLPEIRARLHPYQIEGVAFLAGRGRGLLADDMGLGKTLQAIAAAHWMHRHDGVERVLVVCPASLKLQWAREIERFTGVRVQIVQGPMEARGTQYRRGPGFYVVNYELVMRDLTVINRELCPDLLILDEAQRIKNWRTKIASAVKRIGSRYAFVLTGTPLENRLEDLYSLMQVVDPRILGPLWRYMVDFHITDERGKVLGYRNLSLLRQRLSGVMLRRDRSLVRDQLPERIVQRIDVPMSETQQEIHDAAVKTAGHIAHIMRRRPLTPSEQNRMMAALQQARMACDAAGLVNKETEGAPKLDELEALLDELCRSGGLKAVVFSQWERMTEMVEQRVRRLGLGAVRLHGGVPTHKRGALMDRFRDDDAVQVFISTDAGGVGLNLQNAAVLINLDIPWNPAVLDQRIARVHRLGQQQKVQAILLVAPASYEERVLALVQGKRHLFDNVVDPDATDDVVGVSRRLAEILAEDLRAPEPGERDEPQVTVPVEAQAAPEPTGPEPVAKPAASGTEAQEGPDVEETVRRCITDLQQRFGPRIERILGQRGGGDGGSKASLVLVLDQVDARDDEAIEALAAEIPVALIDQRTLRSLNRLGSASPLAGAESVYTTVSTNDDQESESPLARKAVRNLEAARLLLQQSCPAPALDLLLDAMLAAAALLAGRADPPTVQQAGVWLYREALPTGRISPAHAGLLMQAIALAQAGDTIPADLLHPLLDDAQALIHSATPGSDQGN